MGSTATNLENIKRINIEEIEEFGRYCKYNRYEISFFQSDFHNTLQESNKSGNKDSLHRNF